MALPLRGAAKAPGARRRALGITQRTALLSWLVTTATLSLFAMVIIPQQRRIFLEQLESKARSVAVSLREVTAGAAVNEDFSTVVEHCKQLLDGDREIDYLVVTKNDGFSVIHDRAGWRSQGKVDASWLPPTRVPRGAIGVMPGLGQRAFHYSQPFDYSGIEWGWIHVGLSLERYDRSVAAIYQRTAALAIGCIALSLLGSILYAKRLVRPILNLRRAVSVVAGGDLSARAAVESDDELGGLARAVNAMTAALLHRDQISHSVRFAAERFLSTSRWDEVIQDVLRKVGEAAGARRVSVWENGTDAGGDLAARYRYEWLGPGARSLLDSPASQTARWSSGLVRSWMEQLRRSESVATEAEAWTPAARSLLEPLGIRSLALLPIVVEGSWWGFLGLSDDDPSRRWPDAERASFRAAADMLGAAIARQRTQDALLAAKDAAEAGSQAKSQFLANMSHEIRTPINGVMGMIRLLLRTPLTEKQRRYLTNMRASADTLQAVIGDVLDFSKIEAGKLELEEVTFSPADAVDTAVGLLAEKAEAKGLELASRIGDDLPRQLRGDQDRVKQVLLNLVSNAVKFTEQGTVVLSCARVDGGEGATTLRFEVRDTGPGIAPDQQAMIFDAFSQADSSMSRAHGGTGLGLSISRELVRLMGGQIGVESSPGEGSRFWFTARFGEAPPERPLPERCGPDLRGLRVLVADDCPMVQEILCDYLRSWKGHPTAASDGAGALEALRLAAARGEPFAVAVLDAGMDWVALARSIRRDPALEKTGLVLLANFAGTNFPGAPEDYGFSAWLAKPARRSELYDALARAAQGGLPRPPVAALAQGREAAEWAEPAGSGLILVAEDNEINREVVAEMLAALGYRCLFAGTGREALESAQAHRPDLILMDCQMPEMDGYEATRILRAREREATGGPPSRGRVPIVALTAHALKGDRARCLSAGMDDYLTKPLDPAALARTLRQWLAPSAVPARAPEAKAPADEPSAPAWAGIDLPSLLERCAGKSGLARRLVLKFTEQARVDLEELDAAIQGRDAERLRKVAHRIKGAAANVSAEAVRECASQLEGLGRAQDLSGAPELHAHLRACVNAVREVEPSPARV